MKNFFSTLLVSIRYSRFVAAAIALSFFLPCVVQAGPQIIATNVAPGCNGSVATLTITLNALTYYFYGSNGLYYHFDPPSPGVLAPTGNPAVVQIPSGFIASSSHILWISDSAASTGGSSSPNYPFVVPDCSQVSNKKGLTWKLSGTNSVTGTIRVGCIYNTTTGQNECDPYNGDTLCTTALPLLCIKKTGDGFPLPPPASVDNSSLYNKWSGGIVGTTNATVAPGTLAAADAICVAEFGVDWRLAEFHDGWGWYFQAYGGVGDPTQRFWVDINDQPNGTCWP